MGNRPGYPLSDSDYPSYYPLSSNGIQALRHNLVVNMMSTVQDVGQVYILSGGCISA
jgi:hypothetical protein